MCIRDSMKSIIIIFLFFCLISKRGAADQEYQQIDLYAETSVLKENKKHRGKKLKLEQKKELAKIINKYNLFRDGKTETDVPFIGSRHFFTVDEVKTYIDMMALHNMNRFHWHITEDQGWRLEIKKYPKPVSYTHLDVYKRQDIKVSMCTHQSF